MFLATRGVPAFQNSLQNLSLLAGADWTPEAKNRPEMPRELDARYTHRGIYSAWLSKAKGDTAKAKWIQSSGRRYFSIDFDGQIVFYSHSETDKRISLPIAFRDILGASLAPSGENSPQASMRRSFSGMMSRRPNVGEYPFTLHTRDRRIRLAADSEANAFSWVEMLNAAHRYGMESLTAAAAAGTESSHLSAQKSQSSGTGHFSPTASTSKGSQSTADGDELTGGASSPATWSDSEATQTTPTAERAEQPDQADSESQAPLLQHQEAAYAHAGETPLDAAEALLQGLLEAQHSESNATGKRPSHLEISVEDNAAVSRAPPLHGAAAPSAARLARQAEDVQRPAMGASLLAERGSTNQFQASDFGFEDGPESDWGGSPERSPANSPREIGPPSVAFSNGWQPSDGVIEAATAGTVHHDEVNSWDGSEDEGDDDFRKAREERIQADLFLARQPSASWSRNRSRHAQCANTSESVLESVACGPTSASCTSHMQNRSVDEEQEARIAADLRLLQQPASSSSGHKARKKKKADAVPHHPPHSAPLAAQVTAPAESEEAIQAARVAADLALLPRPLVGGRNPSGYGGYGGSSVAATMTARPTGGYGPPVR